MALLHFICVAALIVVKCCCSTEGQQLKITNLTDGVVEFLFTDLPSGRGLRVVSAQDSLYINTLDGRSLVAAREVSESSLRLISIDRNTFIRPRTSAGKSRDFFVPDTFVSILSSGEDAALQDLVHALNTTDTVHEIDSRLRDAVFTILSYPEGKMLQNAAFALGNAGVTGVKYPSVLPFYMATLRLTQLLQRSNHTTLMEPAPCPGVTEGCCKECPPCPDNDCFGLCGYGCSCWQWVCEDCCYHLGCYGHDICCREHFISTACLFPYPFYCESAYYCD